MLSKIRAVIADDEPLARRGIRQLLALHQDVTVIAEAGNGRETVRAVQQIQPDLLFLDVQMPGGDGFDVLRALDVKTVPEIIFVTAYDDFAVRAFDAQALDYLVKPVDSDRFAAALERMRERIRSAGAMQLSRKLAALLAARDKEQSRQRLLVPTANGELVIGSDEIDWIEADDYYAAIHARHGRHLIRESLASLEQRLDKRSFLRAHRSAIVNIDRVSELRNDHGEVVIVLRDGVLVPVSRRRRASVGRALRHLKI